MLDSHSSLSLTQRLMHFRQSRDYKNPQSSIRVIDKYLREVGGHSQSFKNTEPYSQNSLKLGKIGFKRSCSIQPQQSLRQQKFAAESTTNSIEQQQQSYFIRKDNSGTTFFKLPLIEENEQITKIVSEDPNQTVILSISQSKKSINRITIRKKEILNEEMMIPLQNRGKIKDFIKGNFNDQTQIAIYSDKEIFLFDWSVMRIKKIHFLLGEDQRIGKIFFNGKSQMIIILKNKEIYGWGDNSNGQLGLFLQKYYEQPTKIYIHRFKNSAEIIFVYFSKGKTYLIQRSGILYENVSSSDPKRSKFDLNFQGFRQVSVQFDSYCKNLTNNGYLKLLSIICDKNKLLDLILDEVMTEGQDIQLQVYQDFIQFKSNGQYCYLPINFNNLDSIKLIKSQTPLLFVGGQVNSVCPSDKIANIYTQFEKIQQGQLKKFSKIQHKSQLKSFQLQKIQNQTEINNLQSLKTYKTEIQEKYAEASKSLNEQAIIIKLQQQIIQKLTAKLNSKSQIPFQNSKKSTVNTSIEHSSIQNHSQSIKNFMNECSLLGRARKLLTSLTEQ